MDLHKFYERLPMRCFILLVTIIAGCGRNSEKSGVLSLDLSSLKNLLTKADLDPGSFVTPMTKDDVAARMANMTDLYANEPNTGGADSCIITSAKDIKVTLGSDYMMAEGEGPLSACGSSPNDDAVGGDYKIIALKACAGGNFSIYAGKTFLEIFNMDQSACDGVTNKIAMVQHIVDTDETFESGGQSYTGRYRTISYLGTSEIAPYSMTLNGNQYVSDNLISLTKRTVLKSDVAEFVGKTGLYEKLVDRNVHIEASGRPKFNSSGKVDITVNEWTGSASFLGKDTNPMWQMVKGAEILSGTYAGIGNSSSTAK